MRIHIKHHACSTLSAQQMLNVTTTNGLQSITKDKEGKKASAQEIQAASYLESRERFRC